VVTTGIGARFFVDGMTGRGRSELVSFPMTGTLPVAVLGIGESVGGVGGFFVATLLFLAGLGRLAVEAELRLGFVAFFPNKRFVSLNALRADFRLLLAALWALRAAFSFVLAA